MQESDVIDFGGSSLFNVALYVDVDLRVLQRCYNVDLILYLQNYLLYWQLFVIKGLVHDEVALLLSVLSTALWLLGSDAPTATQVDQAESMLHFFGKHVSEWFGA